MKQEHKYAQVLRWIADGEEVQHFRLGQWRHVTAELLLSMIAGGVHEDLANFRVKPNTVMCNGVEVPAPESVAPAVGTIYFVPDARFPDTPDAAVWRDSALDKSRLEATLVYLDVDTCIARAEAMRITS